MSQRTSAAGDLQVEWTSAAGNLETEGVGTAAAAEHTKIEEDPQIKGTSAAAEHISDWLKNFIFRVPRHIRSGREFIFEPKLVSIGPYFHGRKELERMENLKIRCKEEILKMRIDLTYTKHRRPPEAGNPRKPEFIFVTSPSSSPSHHKLQKDTGVRVDNPFWQFEDSVRKARAYYKEEFYFTDFEFVRMLFLDSCFIIRTILAFSQQTQSMSFLDVHIKEVRSDLLLLDNQIPLFFIKEVYEWFNNWEDYDLPEENELPVYQLPNFYTVLEPFICLDIPWAINQAVKSSEAAHLLDLYWRCSLPPKMYGEQSSSLPPLSYRSETERDLCNSSKIDLSKKNALMDIANATELQQMAGIEFQKFKDKGHLDVTFSKAFFKGIIFMPQLKIDFRQRTLLTNLIVFENCTVPKMRAISCYMKLMDALINSEKDVELLQNFGVIHNTLRSHQMAATFFNDIGDFCFTDDNENLFSGLYTDVKKYYDSSWHRRLASLRHNYFNSPWAGISFFAALILLGLSVVQTVYTVSGYYKPNN